ncbi:MAG: 23S rRNA (adenine(2503)-C(2))-methyltransferase RlmN [Terriglobales bacterium]
MPQPLKTELLGLSRQELSDVCGKFGQPAYRGSQLAEALYRRRLDSLLSISNLPLALREVLAGEYETGLPDIQKRFVSVDGTVRYLISFSDGQSVETVWMPEGDDGEAGDGTEAGDEEEIVSAGLPQSKIENQKSRMDLGGPPKPGLLGWGNRRRATICVSSQAGCAVNCQFCMTALLGLQRNLTAGEIVGQILRVLGDHQVQVESERVNLVFMGQGEPFLNYENFMKAVRLLVEEVGIPASRMTVSTAGIVPRIHDFGAEPVRPKLAISLNASTESQRREIMPITSKWTLDRLMAAAREFPLHPRERLTFEYVLLDAVNDSREHAREVVELLRGIRAKVNLIALNPGPDIPFGTPAEERVHAFQQTLIKAGIPTFIRRPRGRDIYAACGQLKRTELVEIA